MSVAHHNRVLEAGRKRADDLEQRFIDVLVPILEKAGRDAAHRFRAHATNHLTASALRQADTEAILRFYAKPGEPYLRATDLALTSAMDVQSNSTMICVKPRPDEAAAIADPDGDYPAENLHVTLAYLGEIDGDLRPILDALQAVAASHAPLSGVVGGYGQFGMPDGSRVGILLPDVPGLVELRVEVTEELQEAGINYGRDHGFEAHLTVDPDPEPDELERMISVCGSPLHFDDLLLVRGDTEIHVLPLVGVPPVTAAGEPPGWSSPAPQELVDTQALILSLRGKTDPVRHAVVKSVMAKSLEGVGIRFDVTNPLVAKVLAQTGSQIVDIAQTTQANVMRIIRTSYDQGFTIPDTAHAIRDSLGETALTRATLIARTELAGAVNGGSLAATQLASAVTGDAYTKEWLTAPGAQFPRHEEYDGLDGQTVPLDGYFDVGGAQMQYPADPDGPPEEVCNCRCTLVYGDGSQPDQLIDEG